MDKVFKFILGKEILNLKEEEVFTDVALALFAIIAGSFHIFLALFFLYQKIQLLFYINCGSILMYVIAFFLIRKGLTNFCMFFIVAELCGISLISTYYLGWTSNMQWYSLFAIVPVFLFCDYNLKIKSIIVGIIFLVMIATVYISIVVEPIFVIDDILFRIVQTPFIFICQTIMFVMSHIISIVTKNIYNENLKKLEIQATIDPLTGLYNRRYVQLYFDENINVEPTCNYCLAMLDIDNFKSINDTYGHDIGDIILKHFANYMKTFFRQSDIIVRWGGEEFVVFFNNSSIKTILPLMQAFVKSLEHEIVDVSDIKLKYTITAGLQWNVKKRPLADVIKESDALLYEGKIHGKNQVVAEKQYNYLKTPLKNR